MTHTTQRRRHRGTNPVIALLAIGAAPCLAQFGGLDGPQPFAAGVSGNANGSAVADFNNDGLLDILTTYSSANFASLLLGQASGEFSAPILVAAPGAPSFPRAADFNGDGNLDFAVVTYLDEVLRIFEGDGEGGFSEVAQFATPFNAFNLVAGDFNGDDLPDLAVLDFYGKRVLVRFNLGNFAFSEPSPYLVASEPYDAIPYDTDDDGDLDIVVVCSGDFTLQAQSFVSVLRNNGVGEFVETSVRPTGVFPLGGALGDIDGDGWIDIATPNDYSNDVSVLLGDGLGGFEPEWRFDAQNPTAIAFADMDGDGDTDMAVANAPLGLFPGTTSHLEIFINTGGGSLASAGERPTLGIADGLQLADLNGDASPDAIVTLEVADIVTMRNLTPMGAPRGFNLVGPPDGASGLPTPQADSNTWPGAPAALDWTDSAAFFRTYHVRIARNADLTDIVAEQFGLTESRYQIPDGALTPGTTYYWSVTAMNPTGSTEINGGPFQFTTAVRADINNDGVINFADLNEVLSSFNTGL